MALAGCGGSSGHVGSSGRASHRGAKHESFVAGRTTTVGGLLNGSSAADSTAGTVGSYVPTGKIVADSGFRPGIDGFSFENYGNDVGPQNMTPAQVEDIYGPQVCMSGSGAGCVLIPPAKQWMDTENAAMSGGHCMGFSVTALLFFAGALKPSNFGANATAALPIQGNRPLQEQIAEDWTYQDLPDVVNNQVTGTPNHLLRVLDSTLPNANDELYTIGIFNSTGGHAITPIAIEDAGNGFYNVLVYDNNFPDVIRKISFDTNSDTWLYHGGPNPSDTTETYRGDASSQTMVLFPTSPGFQQQPCPFCDGQRAQTGGGTGSLLPAAQRYEQFTLKGSPVNHAHLVLTDSQGRQTGYVGGRLINQIPGALVQRNVSVQNWREAPEPTYRVPVGLQVEVTIDASKLTRPDHEDLTLLAPGQYFDVSNITMDPGQRDTVFFDAKQSGLSYTTNAKLTQAPLINVGVIRGSGAAARAYYLSVSAVGVQGHSQLTVLYDRRLGKFGFVTRGTTGSLTGQGSTGIYALQVSRSYPSGKIDSWNGELTLPGNAGATAVVPYTMAVPAGRNFPVQIASPSGSVRYGSLRPYYGH